MLKQLFLLALLLCIALVNCDKDDGDSRDIFKDASSGKRVEFRSERRDGDGKSRIRFIVKTAEGEVEVRVRYEDKKTKEDLRVRFEEVILFNDTNNNGYTPGEEISTQNIGRDITLEDIACTSSDNENGGKNYDCTIRSTDGSFQVVTHLVSGTTSVDSVLVRPTSVKIDVIFDGTRPAGSSVALVTAVKTRAQQRLEEESDENKDGIVETREKQVKFGEVGWFSWATTASVDVQGTATEIQVVNSDLQVDNDDDENDGDEDASAQKDDNARDENHNKIVFSFLTTSAGKITWDPKLNYDSAASLAGVSTLLMLALITLTQLF